MDLTEFLGEFQVEAGEKLDLMGAELLRLERDTSNVQPVRELFLAAHTIKGGAAMLRLTDVQTLAHAVEELLSSLRDQERLLDNATADLLFQSIDRLRELIAVATGASMGADPDPRMMTFVEDLRANARCAVQAPTAGVQPRTERAAKALLVDDSATVRELHRLLLERLGYTVETCEDGQVALARALAQPFDVVVSGLNCAGLNGFDLCSALRANAAYRNVAIVLTSADADPDLTRRAEQCGAGALVRKGTLLDERLSEVLSEIATPRAA